MIVRPRFIKGLEVMTLPPLNPPPLLNIKEEIINRRPVYLRTQAKERTADPVKAYITQRTDNIKNLITSSGLKVDMSHLQDKLFPIEYTDEYGVQQKKEVRLLDMTLPVEERLKAIQSAIVAKDLNAPERASLAALVGISASQISMQKISEQQRDLLADLVQKIAPVSSYTDSGLDRFHDEITYASGEQSIKFLLTVMKKTVQSIAGIPIPIDDLRTYMSINVHELLDLKEFKFTKKTQAKADHTADYNAWEAAIMKLAPPVSPAPSGGTPGGSTGGTPGGSTGGTPGGSTGGTPGGSTGGTPGGSTGVTPVPSGSTPGGSTGVTPVPSGSTPVTPIPMPSGSSGTPTTTPPITSFFNTTRGTLTPASQAAVTLQNLSLRTPVAAPVLGTPEFEAMMGKHIRDIDLTWDNTKASSRKPRGILAEYSRPSVTITRKGELERFYSSYIQQGEIIRRRALTDLKRESDI